MPATFPIVDGRTSLRRVSSAATDALSSPFPASGTSMRTTVCVGFTNCSIGWNIRPVASARCSNTPIACCIRGVVTFGALTTTCAGVCAPGNSFWIAMYVFTIGMLRGRSVKLSSFVWMPRTGSARTTRNATESAAEIAGCRSTGARIPAQTRDSVRSPLRRRRYVFRSRSRTSHAGCCRARRRTWRAPAAVTATMPRSTRSPSLPSSAGSTVSEPTIAAKTTSIAPTPIDVKIFEPESSIPAIAISTVPPEMSTAWPDVAAARGNASSPCPACRSSRSRFR